MPASHTTEKPLPPALEAIATAAADQLRAQADRDSTTRGELQRQLADAASKAIAAGVGLAAIADAERTGQHRACDKLGPDVLRAVARAAARKHQAETEYEQEILRATRLGLSHREIAAAATVAHGTIRAILARTDPPARHDPTAEQTPADDSQTSI
jgi:DNA-binding NarL/FixJ family response regulator